MITSVLERVLQQNRIKPKTHNLVESSTPIAVRVPSSSEQGPWITSTSKGSVVHTHLKEGTVMQAFFKCPILEEDLYLSKLFEELSLKVPCVGSVARAVEVMKGRGMTPQHLIMPFKDFELDMTPKEAENLMLSKGYVAEVDGLKILSAREAIPSGSALLFANRSETGVYTRSEDFLALTFYRADRSVLVIRSDVAR